MGIDPGAAGRNQLRITFIGGGNMARALIGGLAGKLTAPGSVHVVDPDAQARARLAQSGVSTAPAIGVPGSAGGALHTGVDGSNVVVLAVKPQQMREVAMQLKPHLSTQLVISIAAGIRAVDLSRWLGGYAAIVRTMPNTPALIGRGITGMAALPGVTPEQRVAADAIMRAVGSTVWLDDEKLIDPVTALSGSGPAYVFYFIEAMQQAGIRLGLTAAQATELSIATFAGAAQLAADASEPVSVLRERVTSKGGTTFAALASLQDSGVAEAIIQAVEAASARGTALGEEFGRD